MDLYECLPDTRTIPSSQQRRLKLSGEKSEVEKRSRRLWCAGDVSLVRAPCVAIVGARKASREGMARARRLARELCEAGVVVVSGLAKGIDVNAHSAAISAEGRTIAVVGTPIEKAYPAEHAELQEFIYRNHLLISPFPPGQRVFRSNFPQRNRVMAALSDATVVIEASDSSGTLHQAAECRPDRLDRWLFITRSAADNPAISWPQKFLGGPKVRVLEKTQDILDVLSR